ncbi:unnamed protein product [Enterobius vermicularis]|uniref:Uncharacterized protein n=1 Tax=Enterobius vermicularis TaxID=51028 RepID=A0A0N4VA92_ENTVE|nr:unnamed protein product [Enterobius vermicularis]
MKPLKALTTFEARLGHQSKKNGTGKLNNNVGLEGVYDISALFYSAGGRAKHLLCSLMEGVLRGSFTKRDLPLWCL